MIWTDRVKRNPTFRGLQNFPEINIQRYFTIFFGLIKNFLIVVIWAKFAKRLICVIHALFLQLAIYKPHERSLRPKIRAERFETQLQRFETS